jgi:hypothetical protein
MGGNALDVNTERISARDFEHTKVFKLWSHMHAKFPTADYHVVRPYRNKPDHGDIDVLIKKETVDKWDLIESFGPTEVYNNGDVASLDWTSAHGVPFQLDLVLIREEWWEHAKAFFAYNDLGNLMGKVARWMGRSFERNVTFKWGFQGLRASYYTEDWSEKLGEVTLSKYPSEAFEFLGFSWERFQNGFDDLENVFEYVEGSQFFHKEAFLPSNLTSDQRHRDTKRKTYVKWTEYLKSVPEDRNKKPLEKESLVPRIDAYFNIDFEGWIALLQREHDKKKRAREVLNGRVLMREFGLEGKELGKAIGRFKGRFESETGYHEYLLKVGRERALEDFAEEIA